MLGFHPCWGPQAWPKATSCGTYGTHTRTRYMHTHTRYTHTLHTRTMHIHVHTHSPSTHHAVSSKPIIQHPSCSVIKTHYTAPPLVPQNPLYSTPTCASKPIIQHPHLCRRSPTESSVAWIASGVTLSQVFQSVLPSLVTHADPPCVNPDLVCPIRVYSTHHTCPCRQRATIALTLSFCGEGSPNPDLHQP